MAGGRVLAAALPGRTVGVLARGTVLRAGVVLAGLRLVRRRRPLLRGWRRRCPVLPAYLLRWVLRLACHRRWRSCGWGRGGVAGRRGCPCLGAPALQYSQGQ